MSITNSSSGWMSLTLPQLDFWEEFTFHPDEAVSTVAHYLDIEGDVDETALKQAIEATVAESDVLSLRFRGGENGAEPQQYCDPQHLPILENVDLRGFDDPMQEALHRMNVDVQARIDLRAEKIAAQSLFRIDDGRYLWYIRAHHITVDGYGFALIEQRCGQYYRHFRGLVEAGHAFHPFTSFLAEETAYRNSPRWSKDKTYWRDYLDLHSNLPVIDKGIEDYGAPGEHYEQNIAESLSQTLRERAQAIGIGWPDLLVLLSGAYLFQILPQQNAGGTYSLALWLPFMSRWGSVGAHMPGMLVNILPFHVTLNPQETLQSYLTRSVTVLKKQRLHGRFRIEQIASDRGVEKGSRFYFSPLINVLPFSTPQFDGCRVVRHVLANGPGEGFSMTFRGEDDGSNMTLQMDIDPSLPGMAALKGNQQDVPAFLARALSTEAQGRPISALWDGLLAVDAA